MHLQIGTQSEKTLYIPKSEPRCDSQPLPGTRQVGFGDCPTSTLGHALAESQHDFAYNSSFQSMHAFNMELQCKGKVQNKTGNSTSTKTMEADPSMPLAAYALDACLLLLSLCWTRFCHPHHDHKCELLNEQRQAEVHRNPK